MLIKINCGTQEETVKFAAQELEGYLARMLPDCRILGAGENRKIGPESPDSDSPLPEQTLRVREDRKTDQEALGSGSLLPGQTPLVREDGKTELESLGSGSLLPGQTIQVREDGKTELESLGSDSLLPGQTIQIREDGKTELESLGSDSPMDDEMLDILLAVSETLSPQKDSFQIHIQKRSGFLYGSNDRSVLLGVYHYLHTLGCRFLAPGRKNEVVPVITKDRLYLSYAKTASFDHRGACIEGANSLENVLDFVDWLPKLGYNSFFLQFSVPYTFLARWYNHENNPYARAALNKADLSNNSAAADDSRDSNDNTTANTDQDLSSDIAEDGSQGSCGNATANTDQGSCGNATADTDQGSDGHSTANTDQSAYGNAAANAGQISSSDAAANTGQNVRSVPYTLDEAAAQTEIIESAMKLRGLNLHKVGHGWTGAALGYSSVAWQAEDRPLAEEKRPLAAKLQGVRGLHYRVPLNTNLCYSNSKAVDTFVQLVTDYACSHPEVDYLHIWLADDCNNICECENCRKTTPSDQYVNMLNRIDEQLTARGSDTKLVFLLYLELLWPPLRQRLHNPDRFVLMFAPISRTFESSYSLDEALPPIPEYRRNQISLPGSLPENLSFLKGWQERFHGDGFVYDYHLGRAHYGDLGYVNISRVASEDIKKLHQMGLNGMISCQELRASLPNALPNYVMGHTLFEEDLNFEQLLKEYYEAAYGEDYPEVLNYLTGLSALSSCDYMNGKGPRQNPEMAERFRQLLQMAEDFQAVTAKHVPDPPEPSDPQKTYFWQLLSYHRQYVLLLGKALYYMANGENEKASQNWDSFQDFICRMEPRFQEALDVYRVIEISGNHAGLKRLRSGR